MVRKQHKVLSLILCLMLAVSAVCAGTVGAFAASGDTVYCKLNNGWNKVYAYMWSSGSGNNKDWPGVEMTKVEGDVYSYTLSGNFDKIIFNNGNGGDGNQTADLEYAGNGKIFEMKSGRWSTYIENPTSVTQKPTEPQPTTQKPTVPGGDGVTVYLKNEAGWSSANCYMWSDGAGSNKEWPGEKMTSLGDNIYMYNSSVAYDNCIFNGGSNGPQTVDLNTMDGYIYNNKTSEWSVYDVSPLQFKEYSADPAAGVYVGTDVTLSADAQNKNGAPVSYKFTVTNDKGGASVISNYSSANKVVWTPSATGDYTISFDVKDSEGNENNRTLVISVEDDSALVKPVIKSVFPANLNLIKVNTPATVTVKAGGGKTGTNLLFYKYVVTDPNNVQNTPYYTLNSTYSFTPLMAGEYTVNVYVQGSDNSTVNKEYKYTATTGEITQPTTVAPPTTPTTKPTTPTTKPTEPSFILGDANGDGKVSVLDATWIQKYIADYDGYVISNFKAADADGDGRISIMDATAIQQMLAVA